METIILNSVLEELSTFLKNQPEEIDPEEYVRSYLFSRVPQAFQAQQIPLFSLSVLTFGKLYEVTVNLRSTSRLDLG
jgi:hypothetical protein